MISLYRHRNQVQWTNTELFLLQGNQQVLNSVAIEAMVGSNAWFSQALAVNNFRSCAIGQVGLSHSGARLNWLVPFDFTNRDPLPELLDNLTQEAGLRGAHFVTAGAKLEDCLFETLRRAGFCLCGWHMIWQFKSQQFSTQHNTKFTWSRSDEIEIPTLTALQRKLLSPASQSIAPAISQALPDFTLYINDTVSGYARAHSFNNRVMLMPLMDPAIGYSAEMLASLAATYFPTADAVYFLQTSDSAWMETGLMEIANPAAPREELLVKHLAAVQKIPVMAPHHAANNQRADPAAPMAAKFSKKDNL